MAGNLRRVVVLYDSRTARDVAEAEIVNAPPGRFLWLDAGRMTTAEAREVFWALFGETPGKFV